MNVENLNKLIEKFEGLSDNEFDISEPCGTVCCITGWSHNWFGAFAYEFLSIYDGEQYAKLITPSGYDEDYRRYPLGRAIATLKRLRNTYLSTGQVVVDWGPEPEAEPKQAWTAPQVAEVINPALPAELTSLLCNTVEA